MKKLVHIISAAILSVAFIGSAASAQAAPTTCTEDVVIHNSGNGNVTTVTCNDERTATIICENGIVVGNYNEQGGESGDGESEGGSVETGSVVNYNGTETTIGASCGESPSPTPTPTTSPSVSPSPSTTPGAGAAKPASLPNTASASAETVVVASLIAAAGIVVASRLAVAAYRHFNTK